MPVFVHDQTYRALEIFDRIPSGCIGVIVTREDFEPHLHHAEVPIVDTADREPQHGELYAVTTVTRERSRITASLAIVQAYERDGGVMVSYGFAAPGITPLSDGPFTAAGWRQKCAERIIGAMRPTWQASYY